ncbi:DLH domain-containing protein [Mycena indigotica]|uniref:DLH domain-containing protein n=1 Tax=Mycena indigotica TaxID=2126181 RepID=A0A8H6RYJ4_9AGAR|nr:DLH domain-containing protein [Mycena indigotica]KAF7288731.1 DLH domain-containing protein [Mycena indigotica]
MSCPNCFTGEALEGTPTGTISEIDNAAYFSPGPGPQGASAKRAIILLTDIFGLPLNNARIIADNFAKSLECDVYVPDLFAGRPPVTPEQMSAIPQRAGLKVGFLGYLKLFFKVLPSLFALIRNRPPQGAARALTFINKLQESKKYEKLGAIGYCFGGGVSLILGSQHPALFSSIVIAHPSPPKDAQILGIKAPTAWIAAEDDFAISKARLDQIEALYKAREGKDTYVEYEIRVYPGTAHGFGARPALQYPEVKEAFEKAFQQAVDWFNRTIPV